MESSTLTKNNYNLFYKFAFFGHIENDLSSSINRAYRDLNRTIVGFAKHPRHDEILNNCKEILGKEIKIMTNKELLSQKQFDKWHYECCNKLIKQFENQTFTYGQAQKWINMSLKYYSMILNGKVNNYLFFHIPVDNYILDNENKSFTSSWSKLNNYDEYINFQIYFRNKYKDIIPLDKEFEIWLRVANQ